MVGIERIVVAAEESEASRQGIRTALAWAPPLGASVTLLHVLPRTPAAAMTVLDAGAAREGLHFAEPMAAFEGWVANELADHSYQSSPAMETAYGLPGIEIPRFAERTGADLVVVGRKPRSQAQRRFEGDTADAVARRSTVPCLFVRQPLLVPTRMLVAIDGTERGMRVLQFALRIATAFSSRLSGVIVERLAPGEPPALAASVPAARTAALQRRLDGAVQPLLIRRGEAAAEILQAAADVSADLIVIGYRRGGPPGVIECGSVARYVGHHAWCGVLTIPL
ncbi:MAG TPA: universal stress protein [Gemmatimonadales bacterium]|jgi:nucleotide-binding universal stress UspA family protein|nr:universal stress protein [Gemmatimonadales bacterium]